MMGRAFRFIKNIELSDGEIYLRLRNTARAVRRKGYVPTYYFDICLCRTDECVGRTDLRVGDSETIYYAGHIGYTVYEAFRGSRYSLKACRLLTSLAERHGMERLIITCDPENLPSRRICELFGAKYIETARLPPSHELYRGGARKKCIYFYQIGRPEGREAG